MNSSSLRTTFATTALMLLAVFAFQTRSAQPSSATTSQTVAKPLLLEKDEGERRIWREPPPGDFILKVSPKNNDSQHLVMGTEDMHPGDEFPMHKHLGQDEILYIVKGTVHAHVGDQERDVHAGGTVFIPALLVVGQPEVIRSNVRCMKCLKNGVKLGELGDVFRPIPSMVCPMLML